MNRVAFLRQRLHPVPSQYELAARVGCSNEQIRKIEAGFSNPGLVMARKLAVALGATLDEVFPQGAKRRKPKPEAA